MLTFTTLPAGGGCGISARFELHGCPRSCSLIQQALESLRLGRLALRNRGTGTDRQPPQLYTALAGRKDATHLRC
jgi:hypothetical protein